MLKVRWIAVDIEVTPKTKEKHSFFSFRKSKRLQKSDKSAYVFLMPYALMFIIFIIIPVAIAIGLSFTNFNTIETPTFVGFLNYINLLTQDEIFMQFVLPNTIV